jgi:putative ABC transport system substrate-binding protein
VKRRDFVKLAGGAMAFAPFAASAQEPGRTYRIGSLQSGALADLQHVAFYEELRRNGFVAGQNLAVDIFGYGLRPDQFAAHAAELAAAGSDVILCAGDTAIRAAQQATALVPILGVTENLAAIASPGGNITGVSIASTDRDITRLNMLLELQPTPPLIMALADPSLTKQHQQVLNEVAIARKFRLVIATAGSADQIAERIDNARALGADSIIALASPVLSDNRQTMFKFAQARLMPVIYESPEMAEEGGLLGFGARLATIYQKQLSQQTIKLLKGAKPADVSVEKPATLELVVNMQTAHGLPVQIPKSLLDRASKVIR